jgi:hypothetical protein
VQTLETPHPKIERTVVLIEIMSFGTFDGDPISVDGKTPIGAWIETAPVECGTHPVEIDFSTTPFSFSRGARFRGKA